MAHELEQSGATAQQSEMAVDVVTKMAPDDMLREEILPISPLDDMQLQLCMSNTARLRSEMEKLMAMVEAARIKLHMAQIDEKQRILAICQSCGIEPAHVAEAQRVGDNKLRIRRLAKTEAEA